MEIVGHGGHCCGISHLFGFDDSTEQDLLECIRRGYSGDFGRGPNRILECILTDRQLLPSNTDRRVLQSVRDVGGWSAILRREGFKLKAVWRNSNTGRICYMFHLIRGNGEIPVEDTVMAPTWLDQQGLIYHQPDVTVRQTPLQPVPTAPRLILNQYRAVFRGGRVGQRVFVSVGEVTEAYPRVRQYQCQSFYSDGMFPTTIHDI